MWTPIFILIFTSCISFPLLPHLIIKIIQNHADLLIHEGVPSAAGPTSTGEWLHMHGCCLPRPHPLPLTHRRSSPLNQTGWDASRYALGLTDEFQGTGVFKWIKAKRSKGDGDLGAFYEDDKECVEAETKPETPPPKCDKDA